MDATAVEAALKMWAPRSPRELAMRSHMLAIAGSVPNSWNRACVEPGHFTVSTVVVDGSNQVLLTLHPKFGRWMQLGGHLEAVDQSVAQAALRETLEESGLPAASVELDPVLLGAGRFCGIPCPKGSTSEHLDLRYLVRAGSREHAMSTESLDMAWWPLEDLPDPHDADLALLARQALERLGA